MTLPLILRRARVPATLLPAAFTSQPWDPLDPAVLCDLTLADGKLVQGGAGRSGCPRSGSPD
ncbi:MAG: hypothetical protein ABIV50_07825 [Opitutus sp.]